MLTFLSCQKLVPPNLIYVFSLYKNIFRHQHAHGWSLFFYQLLKALPKLYTYFNYDDNNISFILTNRTRKTHIDIRKKLKLRALKKNESIDILPYMRFHPSDFFTDIDYELTFTINQKTDSKSVIALTNFVVDTKYTINDEEFDMLDLYKKKQKIIYFKILYINFF